MLLRVRVNVGLGEVWMVFVEEGGISLGSSFTLSLAPSGFLHLIANMI